MKRQIPLRVLGLLTCAAALLIPAARAQEQEQTEAKPPVPPPVLYPTAIFPFQERGADVDGFGAQVSDILFASLVADPELYLVDRAELDRLTGELEINLSGMVAPGQVVQVGRLTGAKILITGSIMQVGKKLYIVAKIIGTETSRVLGESVKGDLRSDLDSLVEQLATKVATTVQDRGSRLVAKPVKPEARIAALREKLGDSKRPVVFVRVTERHVGKPVIDPAAQTELTLICRETGFTVVDPDAGLDEDTEVLIEGEGMSEFAMRRGNLVSVKARLEVRAVDRATDRVIATDRQVAVVVDLTEQLAGKAALQQAAAQIAERLLPKLVNR